MTRMIRTSRAGGRRAAGWLLAVALWTVAALAQAQQSPDNLVKGVADDVLRALREDPDLRAGNQTKMAELIEQKIAPHFEFERMTRLAVGKAWRQATDGQKKALMDSFGSCWCAPTAPPGPLTRTSSSI